MKNHHLIVYLEQFEQFVCVIVFFNLDDGQVVISRTVYG